MSAVDDAVLPTAEVIFDNSEGRLDHALRRLAQRSGAGFGLDEAASAWHRFTKTHGLNKIRRRLETAPLQADLVLLELVYWITRLYSELEGDEYAGQPDVLRRLQTRCKWALQLLDAYSGRPE